MTTYNLRELCEAIETHLNDPSVAFLVKLEVWRHSNVLASTHVIIWDELTGSHVTGTTCAEVLALFKAAHSPLAAVQAVIT